MPLQRHSSWFAERAAELLGTQGEIVALIAGNAPLADTLAGIALLVEKLVAPARCSILLLDAAGGRLRHGAAPSLPESYSREIDGSLIGPQAGSCGTAAWRREPVTVADIAAYPLWARRRSLALQHGVRACWSVPILAADGAVLGTFALYYGEPREPDDSDRYLLGAIAPLVALAITQHRKEEALRGSEALNASVVESSADCIKVLDLEGRLLFMNGSGRRAMEIDDFATVQGRCWAALWPDEMRQEIEAAVAAARSGRSARFAGLCPTAKGAPRWWDVVVSPVLGENGRPARLVSISRDATGRQQAEQSLRDAKQQAEAAEQRARQAQARLVDAIEALSEGLVLFDAEDRLVLCNNQYRSLYPRSRDVIVTGTRFADILREGMRRGEYGAPPEGIEAWLADRLARHAQPSAAFEQQLADGRWLRVQERRLPDGGSIGVRIDITDLKRREETFRLLFESNPVPMWVYDCETLRFLEVNRAAIAHYGYSREQFLAMTIKDNHPVEEHERIDRVLMGEREPLKSYRSWRHRRADGTPIDVEITGHLLDFQGRPAELIAAFDVTDRTRSETALREAKEDAEAANRTKSQFLATMSHELRTPLNAILGFSEIIRDAGMGPVEPRYRGYARDIHASGQHLLGLISDILDLSKVEVGRLELHDEAVELPEMVAACFRLVAEKAHTGGVSLEMRLPPDLPAIDADRLRLKQILLNMLSNAVKFTPAGGRVRVTAEAPPGCGLTIAVADTGIGMRQEEIPVALEPFRQIDSAQNRRYEGTGLGLPLAKRLVGLHGGTLSVESEPGRGTTVRVWLPETRVRRGARVPTPAG